VQRPRCEAALKPAKRMSIYEYDKFNAAEVEFLVRARAEEHEHNEKECSLSSALTLWLSVAGPGRDD
jgi:hypothetical protein